MVVTLVGSSASFSVLLFTVVSSAAITLPANMNMAMAQRGVNLIKTSSVISLSGYLLILMRDESVIFFILKGNILQNLVVDEFITLQIAKNILILK